MIRMTGPPDDTEELLRLAAAGDELARAQVLERHRPRLRQMIALRLDRRLAARVDPSDVVQDSLAEAAVRLSDYLRERPLPFYPWLRQLALDKVVDMHRRHLQAKRRSVLREEALPQRLPDESALELAGRLFPRGSSPSAHLKRSEARRLIQTALAQLRERDREVLVLRHLEQLPVRDIAAILDLSEGAVKVRHVRALQRLRTLLGPDFKE
jgi:RNA polymerase sigma-70 factor (ECF subfamily)